MSLVSLPVARRGFLAARRHFQFGADVVRDFGRIVINEVADAVVFLSSDAASYVTAQTLNVNGGLYF